jgi:hypothetical protein
MNDKELLKQAKKNISFKRHFFIYVLVNLLLLSIDYYDNGHFEWFFFTSIGWGIGLLSHYISIKPLSIFSVEKEKERLKNKIKNRL